MCSGMNLKRIDALLRENETELELVQSEIKRIEKKIPDDHSHSKELGKN